MRFAAALLVVHAHAVDLAERLGASPPHLGVAALENFGAAGVDIFFVISGFIITRTAGRASSAAAFAWNRLWRVAPLYYVASIPWIVIKSWVGVLTAPILIASFAFWLAAGPEPVAPALDVGWTLCFEMLFYAAVALIIARGRSRASLVIALSGYAACWIAGRHTGLATFKVLGNPIILEFLMGAAAAWLTPRLNRGAGAALLCLGLAGFVAGIALGFGPISEFSDVLAGGDVAARRVLIWGLPAGLVVMGAIALEPPSPPGLVRRGLARMGDASYALYLSHPLALYVVRLCLGAAPELSGDLLVLTVLAVCPGLGLAVHHWIERPLLACRPGRSKPARYGPSAQVA
ncbi:acyltransferase [Caulobacter sp. 1776]|uniref:acyltransferase family protein n=1 Tax=Caulobacter sp. 1776 TaxID=3156420 RepID=UPI003396E903